MKLRGFDFLETRAPGESFDFGTEIPFPPLYRMFCSLFVLGSRTLKIMRYKNEFSDLNPIGRIRFSYLDKMENQHDLMENFYEIESILFGWDDEKIEHEWVEHKLLKIANTALSSFGGVYVGCGDSNKEEIWLFSPENSSDIPYIKLADNIFEFVQLLEYEFKEEHIELSKKLYKDWGDESWKFRE